MERANRIVGGLVLAVVAASLLALGLVRSPLLGSVLPGAIALACLAVPGVRARMTRRETGGPVYSPRRWVAAPPYRRARQIVLLVLLSLSCALWCAALLWMATRG